MKPLNESIAIKGFDKPFRVTVYKRKPCIVAALMSKLNRVPWNKTIQEFSMQEFGFCMKEINKSKKARGCFCDRSFYAIDGRGLRLKHGFCPYFIAAR